MLRIFYHTKFCFHFSAHKLYNHKCNLMIVHIFYKTLYIIKHMKKLEHTKVKKFAQVHHVAEEGKSQGLNLGGS